MLLHIFRALETAVEELAQQRETNTEHEADDDGASHNPLTVGPYRHPRGLRRVDHLHIGKVVVLADVRFFVTSEERLVETSVRFDFPFQFR